MGVEMKNNECIVSGSVTLHWMNWIMRELGYNHGEYLERAKAVIMKGD